MHPRHRLRNALVGIALAALGRVAVAGDKKRPEPPQAAWDDLSKQVIAKIVASTEDFASAVRTVRKVSCTIDVHLTMNVLPQALDARLTYAWEDRNDSGTLTGDEIDVDVEAVSAAAMRPAMKELKTALEVQTVTSGANLFPLNDIRTVKVDGGYKMRLTPVADDRVRAFLGYEVTYITVADDFRPTSVRSRDPAGGEAIATPTWTRWHERWIPTGWRRVVRSGASTTETERIDEFTDVDGLPLLARVRIQESTTTPAGIVTSTDAYTLRDWKVEKRTLPVTLPGVNTPRPERDPDEDLFRTPPSPAPAPDPARPAPRPTPAPTPPPAPPAADPASAPSVVGTWTADDDVGAEIELRLGADHRFRRFDTLLEEEMEAGTWALVGTVLSLTQEGGGTRDYDVAFPAPGLLDLTADGVRTRWTRKGAPLAPAPRPAPDAPPGPPPPDGSARPPTVVGVWHATDRGVTLRADFRADGRYERSLRTGEDVRVVSGTYTVREDVLELQPAGPEARITLRFRFVDPETLELRDAKGGALRLTRGEP